MLELVLDNQWDTIPKDIVFCKNCVVSNQRPRTNFNKEGICSACEWSFEKDNEIEISYEKNKISIQEIINLIQKKDTKIIDITTDDADLEDVFIRLTKD